MKAPSSDGNPLKDAGCSCLLFILLIAALPILVWFVAPRLVQAPIVGDFVLAISGSEANVGIITSILIGTSLIIVYHFFMLLLTSGAELKPIKQDLAQIKEMLSSSAPGSANLQEAAPSQPPENDLPT